MQLDLGEVERRPAAVPAKITWSISSPRRPRAEVSPITQRKCIDQVRLAAAVGPDDAGQTRLDQELGRLPERLEAGEAELGDLHRLRAGRMLA